MRLQPVITLIRSLGAAGAAHVMNAIASTGFCHLSDQLQCFALATDALRIRITTGANDARARVQQAVVRVVLTDHQRRGHVERQVGMVHLGSRRERLAERGCGACAMFAHHADVAIALHGDRPSLRVVVVHEATPAVTFRSVTHRQPAAAFASWGVCHAPDFTTGCVA